MSNISLEQIDLIIERTNVSFTEAKEALEHCNGDVVEALLYLEKVDRIKSTKVETTSSTDKVTSFINKLNATTFIMKKGDRTYVDVPLSVAIIIILFTFHISVVALILSLIFGIRFYIKGENEVADKINSTLNDIKRH